MVKISKWQARLSMLGFKQVRRVIIFVVGMTVLLFGVALLVLPGPAILVIPAGLAILGLEFRWARRWMRRARTMIRSGETRFFRRNGSPPKPGVAKPKEREFSEPPNEIREERSTEMAETEPAIK
jgi:hypothetical protein